MTPLAMGVGAPVLALAAGAAQAALSPAPSPATVSPLIVQGAAPPKTIEKQARSFVDTHAAPIAKINQIGRWHEPICVQVVNLIPDQAAQVQARVEDVAKAVGLKVMKPGCRSNIQIVVTSQPQGLIDKVAQIDLYAKSPCPGHDPPDGLSAADAAYLTALYASDSEGRLSSEQGDIAGRMAKILIKAQVASR